MEWFTHNPIADMRGPDFLLFYGTVIVLTLALCWAWMRLADRAGSSAPPKVPIRPDPYETAYLGGGEQELARTALFSLIQRGYLRVGEELIGQEREHPDTFHLTAMERTVFEWFSTARQPQEVFGGAGLAHVIASHCSDYDRRARESGLLATARAKLAAWNMAFVGGAVVAALGFYKLGIALSRGRTNVTFLLILGVTGLYMLARLPLSVRLTSRGRAYLQQLRQAFDGLRSRLATVSNPEQAEDSKLPLLVALFGLSVLTQTRYAPYFEMFRKAVPARSGIFGSGSCAVGGCGGGCGGGGCGGGGCGGCGSG